MEPIREGGSTTCPPVLDGSNYSYWKARMIAFLKSIDNKTWKAVANGWGPPVVTDTKGKVRIKMRLP